MQLNPNLKVNIVGASKRIMEDLVMAYNGHFKLPGSPALLEYIDFIQTATRNRLCPCGNDDGQYIQLWSEYANRLDVNRFAREDSAIDLQIMQAMQVE